MVVVDLGRVAVEAAAAVVVVVDEDGQFDWVEKFVYRYYFFD